MGAACSGEEAITDSNTAAPTARALADTQVSLPSREDRDKWPNGREGGRTGIVGAWVQAKDHGGGGEYQRSARHTFLSTAAASDAMRTRVHMRCAPDRTADLTSRIEPLAGDPRGEHDVPTVHDAGLTLPPAVVEPQSCDALYQPDLKGRYVLEATMEELSKIRRLFEQFADCSVRCTVLLGDGYIRSFPYEELVGLENSKDRPIVGLTLEAEVDGDHPSAKLELVAVRDGNVELTLHGSHDRIEVLRRALEDRFVAMTAGYAWFAKRDTSGLAFLLVFGALVAAAEEALYPAALCFLIAVAVWPSQWRRMFPATSFRIGQGEKRHEQAGFWRVTVLAGLAVSVVSTVVVELARTR